jgi:hypothetical protein
LRRRIAAALTTALFAQACASTGDVEKRAFLAAGHELQRQAPEPSFDELRNDLDLYLNDELMDLKDRAKRQQEKEGGLYRKAALIASGATILAVSSGTLNDPGNRGLQYGLGAASAAVALAGFGLYLVRTGELHECREFLDHGGEDLSAWGRLHLVPSKVKVPRALWLDYVDRVAALRGHDSCLRVR